MNYNKNNKQFLEILLGLPFPQRKNKPALYAIQLDPRILLQVDNLIQYTGIRSL